MDFVDLDELLHDFSNYLAQVKAGESFAVTERGIEIARLVPSRSSQADLPPAGPPLVEELLDEMREERL